MEPLDGLILSEVMARVAFRLIVNDFRRDKTRYEDPNHGMCELAKSLHRSGFRSIAAWVLSAAYYTRRDEMPLATWRDWCIRRARLHAAYRGKGQPWRRACDPRVTNRGVTSSIRVERRPWGAMKARFHDDPIR